MVMKFWMKLYDYVMLINRPNFKLVKVAILTSLVHHENCLLHSSSEDESI